MIQATTFAGIGGTTSGANRAIWAVGLRNPFAFAVQPGTGRIFINDVGQNTWEEINSGSAGKNFGWPWYEGCSGVSEQTGGYRDLAEAQAQLTNLVGRGQALDFHHDPVRVVGPV